MEGKRRRAYALLGAIVAGSLWIGLFPHALWGHWDWVNEPVHSAVEAVGGMAAVFLAVILLQRPGERGGWLFAPAMGLLAMGLLDIIHAGSRPGGGFVLLRSVASLAGGAGFALVWLPGSGRFGKRAIPWVVTAASILFGIWTLLFRWMLPVMVRDGKFTTTAMAINFLAGVLFVVAAWRFVLEFHRSVETEPDLFASMALLFGVGALLFPGSKLWDDSWWAWHFVRLIAYVLVLAFALREYRLTLERLRTTTVSRDELAREVVRRQRAEEELRRAAVSRALVGQMQRDLAAVGGLSEGAMFRAGQELAARVEARALGEFLDAFAAMGLGTLSQAETEEARRRWTFSGDSLVETRAGSGRPTGNFTRGFLCGAVTRVAGGARVASAEVACQSMGDGSCRFVVQAVE